MKVLKTVQSSLSLMGYYNSQKFMFFSMNNLAYILSNLSAIISLGVHFLHDAHSTQEGILSVFLLITMVGVFISFVDTSTSAALIFLFIGKIQKIVNEGERMHASIL